MNFLSGLMGHASKADIEKVTAEFQPLLIPGEEITAAFKLIRDMYVFTDKRFIFVDKQGMTGKKVSYLSVPYSKIVTFSKENGGMLDLDAEIKISVQGGAVISLEFKKSEMDSIDSVYRLIGQKVLG